MHKKIFQPKQYFLITLFIAMGVINTFSQILTLDDILIHEDVVYTVVDGLELKLDIAVPKYLDSPAPAIVDIPGGAWRKVNKSVKDAVFYAKYGFIGVSITHRTSDIAIFPAAVHDCKTVIRWLRANAEKYNINPNKIGVTGVSSGGHLATLLGTSSGDKYLEGNGDYLKYSSSVQAVVDHFGPTDFLQGIDTTGARQTSAEGVFTNEDSPPALFLGGPLTKKTELARLANPITYIDSEDAPTFIGHGEQDGMVSIKQSEILFDAFNNAGVPTKFVRVKNANHQYIAHKWDIDVTPSVNDMYQFTIRWFEKWLGKPEINLAVLPDKESSKTALSTKNYHLFYRLVIDLPGKTKSSYCKGRFTIRCEGKILAKGEILMNGLTTEEDRTFQQNVVISGIDLSSKEILWNFRGEIFDSELDGIIEPGQMQGANFDNSIKGVGYHLNIGRDKSPYFEKKVYRK